MENQKIRENQVCEMTEIKNCVNYFMEMNGVSLKRIAALSGLKEERVSELLGKKAGELFVGDYEDFVKLKEGFIVAEGEAVTDEFSTDVVTDTFAQML